MIYFIDIDGTLTDKPHTAWGEPIGSRIEVVRALTQVLGNEVTLWSARGAKYARKFAQRNGIKNVSFITKPDVMVDDIPTIRADGKLKIISPEDFFA